MNLFGNSNIFRWPITFLKRWSLVDLASVAVVATCSLFVLAVLNPSLLVANTTPTGGDMGAHVWAPAYLRDELLPNFRLSGWAPDWYAGFPAYRFYMVLPALLIVVLNVGFTPWLGIPAAFGLTVALVRAGRWFGIPARYLVWVGVVTVALVVSLPYGVAFKLVSVSGLFLFPLSVWYMARMARAAEPIPAFLSLAATVFLFDASFWILGGNIMSTLAGEYSFSLSLAACFFALGLCFRGMETGRYRAQAALMMAVVALSHIIPVFFMLGALAFMVLLGRKVPRYPIVALTVGFWAVLFLFGPNASFGSPISSGFQSTGQANLMTVGAAIGLVVVVGVVVKTLFHQPDTRRRLIWLTFAGVAAMLLAAFWLVPFVFQGAYFNDMGWTRLDNIASDTLTPPMRVALPIAGLAGVTTFVVRERLGMLFSATAVVSLAAVANLPQGALWNERILPFYYLSVYCLCAVGLALWLRAVAVSIKQDFTKPGAEIIIRGMAVSAAVVLIGLSMPLRTLPFGQANTDGSHSWGPFVSTEQSRIVGWTQWNYTGYEERNSYGEYHHVVTTMAEIGETEGCGRAMWEFDSSLDRYGTPMALMLLPHWTDGCIGSMEGLFFESSATTPFHFLNQSVLSQDPSRAQRDLPYLDYEIDVGVRQLQLMGVKYYMALSDASVEAADGHSDLRRINQDAQPFVVYEVLNSELVEGLEYLPQVVPDTAEAANSMAEGRFTAGWLGAAVAQYNDPASFGTLPAEDGPVEWDRTETFGELTPTSIEPTVVSNVELGTDRVSFSVDDVGQPVLVKVSHFPNWDVDGAEGPYRVGPNLMAVVPTDNDVSLSYGRHSIEYLAYGLTLLGFAAVFWMVFTDRKRLALAPLSSPSTDRVVQPDISEVSLDSRAELVEASDLNQQALDSNAEADVTVEPPE